MNMDLEGIRPGIPIAQGVQGINVADVPERNARIISVAHG